MFLHADIQEVSRVFGANDAVNRWFQRLPDNVIYCSMHVMNALQIVKLVLHRFRTAHLGPQ